MRKKLWILTGLLLIVPGLLFTVSCAKKVVQSVPVEAPAAAEEPVLDAAFVWNGNVRPVCQPVGAARSADELGSEMDLTARALLGDVP